MTKKSEHQLIEEIAKAKQLVVPAQTYIHYKGGEYEVIDIAVTEATNELCVVYKSLTIDVIFTRLLSSWLENVEIEENIVKRFALKPTK